MVISRLFLLIVRNVLDKFCRENQNTHFGFKTPRVYKVMWKNLVRPDRQTGKNNLTHALCMLYD